MVIIATLVTIFLKWVLAATQINILASEEFVTIQVSEFSSASTSTSAKASYTGPPFIRPPLLFPGEIVEPPKARPSPDYLWRVPFDTNQTFYRFLENNFIINSKGYYPQPPETSFPKPPHLRIAEKSEPPIETPIKSKVDERFPTDSVFEGDATFFYPNLGACGVLSTISERVVALSHGVFDQYTPGGNPNENLCGRKITAFYEDKDVDVIVVDRLGGGGTYDISLSPLAFSQLAVQGKGRIRVTWVWA